MLKELKNARSAHTGFSKAMLDALGPLEWLSKAHLLVRTALSNQTGIRNLSEDPGKIWVFRIIALIGFLPVLITGFATLVFMMATAGFITDVASEGGIGFNRGNYYAFFNIAFFSLIVAYGLSVIDKVSLHRAARKVSGTEYLQALKRLMMVTEELEIPQRTRSALSKAILRYTQAATDFSEQPHQSWWRFVRKQKPDEAALGYRAIKLMAEAGAFLNEAQKAINLRQSKAYLKKNQHAERIDVDALVSDVDAFWVKLIGARKFRSELNELGRVIGHDRETCLTLSAGLALFIAIGIMAMSEATGLTLVLFLPLTWAVVTSTLCGLFTKPVAQVHACLAWNHDQATTLIHRMALLLLRDSQGDPLFSKEFDQDVLGCLAAMNEIEDGVSPTTNELYTALRKLTDSLVEYRQKTL